jgi:hypothetical protein
MPQYARALSKAKSIRPVCGIICLAEITVMKFGSLKIPDDFLNRKSG